MTIGQLAKQAGVSVETIRYYEREGLVKQPHKPIQGYRQYSIDTLKKLLFIKRSQGLGFTLAEIQTLLTVESSCDAVQGLTEQKLVLVRQKIASLTILEKSLTSLIDECKTNQSPRSCPIIASLLNEGL